MNMFSYSILLLLKNGDVLSEACAMVDSTFDSELVRGSLKSLKSERAGFALQVQIM